MGGSALQHQTCRSIMYPNADRECMEFDANKHGEHGRSSRDDPRWLRCGRQVPGQARQEEGGGGAR